VDEITESTTTPWCTGETSGPPRAPTPAFSTGDFINLDEEVDSEEREFEPKAEPEQEVTSQFRVVHHTGDVAGKPIEIESDEEGELPSHGAWRMLEA
jgi:hypothetical protein